MKAKPLNCFFTPEVFFYKHVHLPCTTWTDLRTWAHIPTTSLQSSEYMLRNTLVCQITAEYSPVCPSATPASRHCLRTESEYVLILLKTQKTIFQKGHSLFPRPTVRNQSKTHLFYLWNRAQLGVLRHAGKPHGNYSSGTGTSIFLSGHATSCQAKGQVLQWQDSRVSMRLSSTAAWLLTWTPFLALFHHRAKQQNPRTSALPTVGSYRVLPWFVGSQGTRNLPFIALLVFTL